MCTHQRPGSRAILLSHVSGVRQTIQQVGVEVERLFVQASKWASGIVSDVLGVQSALAGGIFSTLGGR